MGGLGRSLKETWFDVVGIAADFGIAAAERATGRHAARSIFNEWINSGDTIPADNVPGVFGPRKQIQMQMRYAGEDIKADEPYIRVLGLKGGRKEFDALFPGTDFVPGNPLGLRPLQ